MALLEHYFLFDHSAPLLHGRHDPALVVLSVLVAIAASALALYLATWASESSSAPYRGRIIASGSLAMGIGIWVMHFVGMLAFDLPVSVSYNLPITALSLLPGLGASWAALWLLVQPELRAVQLLKAALLMAVGIGAMHYIGMEAMRMTPLLRHDPAGFALSIAVAVVFALLGLWVRFGLGRWSRLSGWQSTALAAVVMGVAIAGTHYMAMHAARFVGTADPHFADEDAWRRTLALLIALVATAISIIVGAFNALLRSRLLYAQIDRSQARLHALVDTAADGIVTITPQGLVTNFNRAAERLFGWQAQEVLGRNVKMLMPESYRGQHDGYLARYLQTHEAHIIGSGREVVGQRKDGSTFPMRLAVGQAQSGGELAFVGFVSDLTELKQAQERQRIAASVFHHSYEAVMVLDDQHRVSELNPAFERLTGLPRAQCLGQTLEALHPTVDFATTWRIVSAQGFWQGEMTGAAPDGSAWARRVSIATVRTEDGAQVQHYVVVISDISQIKAHEHELERIALYDSLTGLPNRRLLGDRLAQAIGRARRERQMLAVCYLDLDGFKQVNDQLGHEAGDQLLIEIGRRIQALLRAADTLARLGGDEMVLLIGAMNSPADCEPAIKRVLRAISEPVVLAAGEARVSGSMGVAIYPLDADTPDLLLRRADHAMYDAKHGGKNRSCRFVQDADASAAAVS